MVFLIREMYIYTRLQGYKVVLLTDRTQLDEQIKQTASATGYSINDPSSISELKRVLKTDTAEIVSAMIHKFQEREYQSIFPELNASDKILILTDEAHRTQYSELGSNLDKALPNATRIAFTGTPIGKTESTFGDYIDKYTMRQAIEDGVTLEIVYEGRTHNADIDDTAGADKKFQDVFKDYNTQQQVEALAFGTRHAYLEAADTIREKAADMLRHYAQYVFPNGYKAQVVAVSKEAAHRYKLALAEAHAALVQELEHHNPFNCSLDAFRKLETAVVISDGSHNDPPYMRDYSDSRKRKLATEGFKLKFGKTQFIDERGEQVANGNIGILIVVDMLLTGFDAPIEQVMYLDKVIVNHNLLQAIARVNRVYDEKKTVGFVVDYVGMGNHLKRALDAYWDKEQQEITGCLADIPQLMAELKTSHEKLNKVLQENGLADYDDADDIFNLLADDDIRHDFTQAYQAFAKALDNVFPRKEALEYIPDLNRFSAINVQASQYFRDQRMSMKGVSEKLRKVTDEFLKSKGINIKIEPISIMDDKFFENIKNNTREKSRAAATEHAIREIINISMDEDQELYASFTEELRRILLELKDNWEEIYKQLEGLRARMKAAQSEPTYGLNRKVQMPIYRKLHALILDKKEGLSDDEINMLVIHTKEIYGMLKTELSLIGFWASPANVARLRGEIQNYIVANCSQIAQAFKRRNEIANEILAWAKDDRITSAIQYAAD
jgi:type I restriction enzyme R subunit